jgi:GT2 family glycosyltransferase
MRYNSGYGAGNNLGIRKAISDGYSSILIVNNDVVPPGFLQPLIKGLYDQDGVGAVTGKVLYKDSTYVINADGGKFSWLLCIGINQRIGQVDNNDVEKKEIDFIPGMLMLLKRESIEWVRLMEENNFLYFEGIDYSLQIKKFYKMIYTSASIVYHKSGGGIRGKSYTKTYLYYYTRNRFWSFRNMSLGYRLYVFGYCKDFSRKSCIHES